MGISKWNDSLIGKQYGYLIILGYSHIDKHGNICVACKCICGRIIKPIFYCLRKRNQISCGCVSRNRYIHGYSKTKLYNIWHNMIERCTYPDHISYKNYGGRGIKICPEWYDFLIFRFQMRKKYLITKKKYKGEKISIERINNNKNYYYANCHFILNKFQQKHRRNVIPIKATNRKTGEEVYAETQTELAEKINISIGFISRVIHKHNKSTEWIIRPLLNPQ